MDEKTDLDPEVVELVVQLCTKVGMMMEDICPLALDVAHQGIQGRVAELTGAIGDMLAIANAASVLLRK